MRFNEIYQPDGYLFERNFCENCGTEGTEIDGMIFDDETQKYFCNEDCRIDYVSAIQSMIEDGEER
jgi:hypothetical protein